MNRPGHLATLYAVAGLIADAEALDRKAHIAAGEMRAYAAAGDIFNLSALGALATAFEDYATAKRLEAAAALNSIPWPP